MESGGLYSLILHQNSQSLIIISVHWTQLLEYLKIYESHDKINKNLVKLML